jgi:peptidoglycan/LPS O-acetylase OafA/YrhL
MYLLNLGIIAQIMNKNFPPINALHAWVQYGLYWFLVIVLSTLLYKFYEKPMMKVAQAHTKSCRINLN